jgi:hypothetical protein
MDLDCASTSRLEDFLGVAEQRHNTATHIGTRSKQGHVSYADESYVQAAQPGPLACCEVFERREDKDKEEVKVHVRQWAFGGEIWGKHAKV